MAKRERAKKPAAAAASDSAASEPVTSEAVASAVASTHYEGRQEYPRAVYGKFGDGTIVAEKVVDRADHDRLLAESPEMEWADSPADHGLETAPAAPAESVKHPGIVGKV